jgi:hypothetical protein
MVQVEEEYRLARRNVTRAAATGVYVATAGVERGIGQ